LNLNLSSFKSPLGSHKGLLFDWNDTHTHTHTHIDESKFVCLYTQLFSQIISLAPTKAYSSIASSCRCVQEPRWLKPSEVQGLLSLSTFCFNKFQPLTIIQWDKTMKAAVNKHVPPSELKHFTSVGNLSILLLQTEPKDQHFFIVTLVYFTNMLLHSQFKGTIQMYIYWLQF